MISDYIWYLIIMDDTSNGWLWNAILESRKRVQSDPIASFGSALRSKFLLHPQNLSVCCPYQLNIGSWVFLSPFQNIFMPSWRFSVSSFQLRVAIFEALTSVKWQQCVAQNGDRLWSACAERCSIQRCGMSWIHKSKWNFLPNQGSNRRSNKCQESTKGKT